jgi:hypothetical protein
VIGFVIGVVVASAGWYWMYTRQGRLLNQTIKEMQDYETAIKEDLNRRNGG